ncbi:MAG: TrlF family AAA-like ATPase [Pseudomonadota bacterium]
MDKGAHFHRCDFQVHSPRDRRWAGTHYVSDEDRRNYAARFIDACRATGLDAVAITDHHDLAFVNFIREAAKTEVDQDGNPVPDERQIVVFPGIELTLNVPCQALLIFDAELPEDLFSLALNALAITPSDASEPTTAEVARLEHITTLEGLRDELDKHEYLRKRYIILPNVSDGGSDTLLRTGAAPKYKSMPCVGGYLDGSIEQLGRGNQDIVNGRAREYGNKRIAIFQTSDSRREDHRSLGGVSTWVKWATPTAEALRQACLAQESRVSQEEPRLPAVTIKSISVSNSKFLGPIDMEFNPQYSALIGGRGTGKSTILEYLRWALCDQPPLGIEDDEMPNYLSRRRRLIDQTLKPVNATVEVQFEVNGVGHTVRRESENGDLLIKIAGDEMRACSEEEVRRLLPIQAYSQKQLSDVSVRVDELSRFVTAPILSELDSIGSRLADREERIRESYATVRRRRALARAIEERQLAETSLKEQAEALRSGLTGLSAEDRALLDRGKVFTGADQALSSWRDGAMTLKENLQDLSRSIESQLTSSSPVPAEPELQLLEAAHGEFHSLLSDVKASLDSLAARAEAITAETTAMESDSPWRIWAEKISEFNAAYEAAVQRSSAHREKLEQLKAIEDQLQAHMRETNRAREELRVVESAEDTYREEREAWSALMDEHADKLDEQCAELTSNSGGAIRARVQRYADPSGFVDALKSAVSGSRVPGSKIEALSARIADAAIPEAASELWSGVLADLEKLAEFDEERDGADQRPDAPALAAAGLTPANLDGVGRSLSPESWLTLSLTPIKSVPVFDFQAREQDYIPFRNASAGQQATALLKTLLNQPGSPLIIDQPEEDLDNPVMLEIVERVWHAKQKRQLIFASHNANLVVNGDAELVAWCDYRTAGDQSRGTIAGEGAIDVDDVREAIKRIMEGGEAAFNLRREKYGF